MGVSESRAQEERREGRGDVELAVRSSLPSLYDLPPEPATQSRRSVRGEREASNVPFVHGKQPLPEGSSRLLQRLVGSSPASLERDVGRHPRTAEQRIGTLSVPAGRNNEREHREEGQRFAGTKGRGAGGEHKKKARKGGDDERLGRMRGERNEP